MATRFFGPGLVALLKGQIDFDDDTIKALLVTSSFTPDFVADDFRNDVDNEVSGTGYTTGGMAVANLDATLVEDQSLTGWTTATAYALNDLVRPSTANGYCYRCTVAGTSHASVEPTWPTVVGECVTDGTAEWVCFSQDFVVKLDGDDVTWTGATITARAAVLYKDTGNAATDPLIAYIDFGGDITSTNGPFTISWDSAGVLYAA